MDELQNRAALAAFDRAGEIAGTWTAFADICGCTPGNISQLRKKRSPLPGRYVISVEKATGVPRHELRPDLYPLTDVPAERTVGNGAPIVSCDRSAGLQRAARA